MIEKLINNEDFKRNVKLVLTNFDFEKEKLSLYAICNVCALHLLKQNVSKEEVINFGLSLGYGLREITIIKSTPESISEILKSLYEANINYFNNFNIQSYTFNKNPFGVTDVIPFDVLQKLPNYETELSSLTDCCKTILRS